VDNEDKAGKTPVNHSRDPVDGQVRWKPTADELGKILQEHKRWDESGGREGSRAEIYYADLTGADLYMTNLRGTRFYETLLYDASLRSADLTECEGLEEDHLAGADLTGAILPDSLGRFVRLDRVRRLYSGARLVYILLAIVLIYTWLSAVRVSDAVLFSGLPSLRLPYLQIGLTAQAFFIAAPLVLLVLYLYVQLRLQRAWETIGELPAVFPDSEALDKKMSSWFLRGIVRAHVRIIREKRSFISRLLNGLGVILVWWLVPLTLVWLWFIYLVRHDWTLTWMHIGVAGLGLSLALFFQRLARRTLRTRRLKGWGFFPRLLSLVVIGAALYGLSYGIIEAESPLYAEGTPTILTETAETLGIGLHADFSHREVSLKDRNIIDTSRIIEHTRGAQMTGFDLRFLRARGTYLARAALAGSRLNHADLDSADLRYADLAGADLTGANLRGALLYGADLTGTILTDADLYNTDLRRTSLTVAALRSGRNWLYAFVGEAVLDSLNLPPDHNQRILRHDLGGADLAGTGWRDASLVGFNLAGASFRNADLTGADLADANLFGADFRGAVGLTRAMLDPAKNWFFAQYDSTFLADLGLPPDHNARVAARNLRGYDLKGINLSRTDLKGANLRQVDLTGAVLHEVNLQDADLYAVKLNRADLTGSNFKGTVLLDTELRGANLAGVINLTVDQIRWAVIDSSTTFPDYLKDSIPARLYNRTQ